MDIMNKDLCSLKEMKEAILDANKKFRMKRCGEKAPRWLNLQDGPNYGIHDTLDLGWKAVLGLKMLSSCLLYTSPSPRDATLSRMPSSA